VDFCEEEYFYSVLYKLFRQLWLLILEEIQQHRFTLSVVSGERVKDLEDLRLKCCSFVFLFFKFLTKGSSKPKRVDLAHLK